MNELNGIGYLVAAAFGVAVIGLGYGFLYPAPRPPPEQPPDVAAEYRLQMERMRQQIRAMEELVTAARRDSQYWFDEARRLQAQIARMRRVQDDDG